MPERLKKVRHDPTTAPCETLSHVLYDCPHLQEERSKGLGILTQALQKAHPRLDRRDTHRISSAYWNNIKIETRAGIPNIAIRQWVNAPVQLAQGQKLHTTRILKVLFSEYLNFCWKLWKHRNSLVHSAIAVDPANAIHRQQLQQLPPQPAPHQQYHHPPPLPLPDGFIIVDVAEV